MKFAPLAVATAVGMALIGIVGWALLLVREHFVYAEPHLPWGIFVAIAGGAIGGAFAFAMKICLREVRRLTRND
jgi:hypothetical protein